MNKWNPLLTKLLPSALTSRDLPPKRIKAIRQLYGVTQMNFADLLMINYETYRSWEEGRRRPSSPGSALLYLAEQNPKIFLKQRKHFISQINQLFGA